jgi:hypothetical protein
MEYLIPKNVIYQIERFMSDYNVEGVFLKKEHYYTKEDILPLLKYIENNQIYDKLGSYSNFYYKIKRIIQTTISEKFITLNDIENSLDNPIVLDFYNKAVEKYKVLEKEDFEQFEESVYEYIINNLYGVIL